MNGFEVLWELATTRVTVLTCELVLSAIFLLSGGFKLRRPGPAVEAMISFGVVSSGSLTIGRLLGALEIVVGGAILVPKVSRGAAVAALMLSLCFVYLIVRALRSGSDFKCACLGDSEDDRVSPLGAWRAVGMVVGSFIAIVGDGHSSDTRQWMAAIALAALLGTGPPIVRQLAKLQDSNARLVKSIDWENVMQSAVVTPGRFGRLVDGRHDSERAES